MAVFLDASFFYALKNSFDVHHEKAKEILHTVISDMQSQPITTDYIFDEIVTVTMRKVNKQTALELGFAIIDSEVILARIDTLVFEQAWSLFQTTTGLSFTDCTSVAFMNVYGIKKIATFDKGFLQIEDIEVLGL